MSAGNKFNHVLFTENLLVIINYDGIEYTHKELTIQ